MRCADRIGLIVVGDSDQRRTDDLGGRREIGRERIEAEPLDDLHEREGWRLPAREIPAKRKSEQSFPGCERDLGCQG